MASLFEMNEQMIALDNLLAENTDTETGEILVSARETLMRDIENKVENILEYISECKSKAEYLKSESDRLTKKAKVLNNRVEWLKKLVFDHLKLSGKQKAEYGTWNVSIAKTPDSVELIDDAVAMLPDEMCRITRSADKTAIKGAMTDGEYKVTVDGREITLARLVSGESLRIR